MICQECGGDVEDPTLYLAQPFPDTTCQAYCGPVCGAKADASTTNISTAAHRGTHQ
jgi:hypothetical protein